MSLQRFREQLTATAMTAAFIIYLVFMCSSPCSAFLCQQIDAGSSNCRCQFDDPDNTVIDFEPISRKDGHPEFPFDAYNPAASEWNYAFNPCHPFDTGPSQCNGKSVCQQNKNTPTTAYNLGDPVPTKWDPQDENTIIVTYASPEPEPDKRTSVVSFTCDQTAVAEPTLEFKYENPQQTYHFTVQTCYACREAVPGCDKGGGGGDSSSKLTGGGVICIIFTVLVVVYIGGGILFQKFGRGAKGKELIPNYAFWSDFPALVKDGFLFMISPCRKDDGYSSI